MYGVVMGLHLLVCFALVGVVLIQSGKGGGLAGGAFGGATQTVFGGRGANDFITRATIGLGITFFVTSVVLALMTAGGGGGRARSVIQEEAVKAQQQQRQQQGQQRGPSAPGGTTAPGGAPTPAGGAR